MSTNGKPETGPEPDEARRERDEQATETAETLPGKRRVIGGYRIVRKLGEGGMGMVYEAEQQRPRRAVALKVVRGGRHISQHDVKLFQREVQALARLKHPGIGAIYEAGRTEEGQHFFAMELVRGERLTDYVRRKKPPVRQRLELFCKICEAINYAHQRGVIHRDLKPSNILIDAEGNPKVLDFGLARITESDISVTTVVTEIARIQGTLPYMSPEQARGNPDEIDLRSDAYSLGVILYELLTGELPYDVTGAMLHEAVRIICEEPPRRPSTLNRTLRGDVETIALKALEKEPSRRYQSASALADDVERYLTDQPILARPPSAIYQLRKLVARHKAPFAFVAALFVLVAGFGIWMSVLYARAERLHTDAVAAGDAEVQARTKAETEAEKAGQIQRFLQNMLASADPTEGKGHDTTVREILDTAAVKVQTDPPALPEVEAAIRHTIGVTYSHLGFNEQAEPHLRKALALRRRALGAEHLDVAETLRHLSLLLLNQGSYDEAMTLSQEALAICSKLLGDDHILTLEILSDQVSIEHYIGDPSRHRDLAALSAARILGKLADTESFWDDVEAKLSKTRQLWATGKRREAETFLQECLAPYMNALGPNAKMFIPFALVDSARDALKAGDYDLAEPLCREALAMSRDFYAEEHPTVVMCLNDLAALLYQKGDYTAAEPLCREALAIRRKLLGDDNPSTLTSINNMGLLLQAMGKLAEAEPYYREALEGFRRVLGDDHPNTLRSINNMGALLQAMGKLAEAEAYYREALEGRRRVLGDDHPTTLISISNMGGLFYRMARLAEAEPYFREALEGCRRVLGDDHPDTLTSINNMGGLLQAMGRLAEAEGYFREALEGQRRVLGDDHQDTLTSINNMGLLLESMGSLTEAEPYYREALEARRRVLGDDHPDTLTSINNMGFLLESMGKYAEAEAYLREALEGYRRVLGDDHPDTLAAINNMGGLLRAMGKLAEAEPYYREALAGRRKALPEGHPDIASSLILLAICLIDRGEPAEGEPLLRECLEIRRKALPEGHWLTANTRSVLGECLTKLGRYDEAEALLLESYPIIKGADGAPAERKAEALRRIVDLYDAWGKPDKAHEYRALLPQPEPATQPATRPAATQPAEASGAQQSGREP